MMYYVSEKKNIIIFNMELKVLFGKNVQRTNVIYLFSADIHYPMFTLSNLILDITISDLYMKYILKFYQVLYLKT